MLSRTADNLFWLARYIERSENLARLLDVGLRMASLAQEAGGDESEWRSTLVAAGCEASFAATGRAPSAQAVIDHLTRDPGNPSSILACLEMARRNARADRTGITTDMWGSIGKTNALLPRTSSADAAGVLPAAGTKADDPRSLWVLPAVSGRA